DVDGVLTDGSITYTDSNFEIKTFSAKDGQGMVMLVKDGFITAIITARQSKVVELRAKDLGVTHVYQGCKNKILALDELITKYSIDYSNVAYMGDDLPDICVLEKVGFACCPSDAVDEVKSICHYVAKKAGGKGAAREMTDLIIKAKNQKENKIIGASVSLPSIKK
ncbi:MAG: HAD hydrolase family protein, partial [Candidatus Gastranaerophilaceae bacterium]